MSDSRAECGTDCAPTGSARALNNECFCLGVDPAAAQDQLSGLLDTQGLPALAQSHPHLFSALPVFVSRRHMDQLQEVVRVIADVTALPAYRAAVLDWAPEIARFDPGSEGGLLGLDFHLAPVGPRLIEINTNPGGALLNALLGRAQLACNPQLAAATPVVNVADAVLQVLMLEWQQQFPARKLGVVAIVDQQPEQQYLYPEFLLYQAALQAAGLTAVIADPQELEYRDHRLYLGHQAVDLVYNRLTDFSLADPAHRALRLAWLAGDVALSPHPHAHALYADKRNLSVLGNAQMLQQIGASPDAIRVLTDAVPRTTLLTAQNRDQLWAQRRGLFFKPAAGYGSKASYRGDKLTRGVWEQISLGNYVAQELVMPGERRLAAGSPALKFDLRCYAYRGQVLLYAARVYQGQTTNFRTPGGGFSPVLTSAALAA